MLSSQSRVGTILPVNTNDITLEELRNVARKFKNDSACGVDGVPAEYWKIIFDDEEHAIKTWVLDFCNSVWHSKQILLQWHESRVVALFKKGDIGDCINYRPISLISASYKLFVGVILARLKEAGAEDCLWST